jgi:hypothetical protein
MDCEGEIEDRDDSVEAHRVRLMLHEHPSPWAPQGGAVSFVRGERAGERRLTVLRQARCCPSLALLWWPSAF